MKEIAQKEKAVMRTSVKILLTVAAFVGIASLTYLLTTIVDFLIKQGYIHDSYFLGIIILVVILSTFIFVNYLIWKRRKQGA